LKSESRPLPPSAGLHRFLDEQHEHVRYSDGG
jgi:hypothetical protein